MDIIFPVMTGMPFNDANRYLDWFLTVPWLLLEILLVMKMTELNPKARTPDGSRGLLR